MTPAFSPTVCPVHWPFSSHCYLPPAEEIGTSEGRARHRVVPVRLGQPAGLAWLVGPICESADVLASGVPLPNLAPGDLVTVLDAGAYGMVMASNYNGQPRPAEVVVTGDQAFVTRRRETWDDLLTWESMPATRLPVSPSPTADRQAAEAPSWP
jgi:hypothetical protein